MTPVYLALIDPTPQELAQAAAAGAALGLEERARLPDCALFGSPDLPVLSLGPAGFIIGTLLHRHGRARPVSVLAPQEVAQLAAGGAQSLLRSYWGSYVACLREAAGIAAMRDPSGGLPCYVSRLAGGLALSADASLLIRTGLSPMAIDYGRLAGHLYRAALPTSETALAGIEELLPGYACSAGKAAAMRWSPADHLADSGAEIDELAGRLGQTVRAGVVGLSEGRGRLLVSLSGGLDSSIVAACLVEAGQDVLCLTMYGPDASGDERIHARSVAARLGVTLLEHAYRVEDVDILAPLNAHLPRPMGRSQALAYERVHMAAAAEYGAGAFVTGNGGDNVFAHSQSAASIADRWQAHRWDGVAATLKDTCRQTGCSPLAALKAARRILKAPPGYRWKPDPALLSHDVCTAMEQDGLTHPWLAAVPSPAGKAAHVAALLRVQQSIEPMRGRMIPVINPLLAQPIVETALAIPSWRWREGGTDRAAARRAFADRLPQTVIRRQAKGGPDGFSRKVVTANLRLIRERLIRGQLVAHGIVDPGALAAALEPDAAIQGTQHVRLQELLVAEAWLDHWSGVRSVI